MALGTSAPRVSVPTPVTKEIILHPPRMGVVAFQNPADPGSGVACVAPRGQTVFSRRNELASDVIWISDATQAINAQNFRPSNYLRSTPSQIASDLGVLPQGDGLEELAKTVGRVRDIAAHAYKWNDFSTDWSHKNLSECIAKFLPSTGEVVAEWESALRQAFQPYSMVPDLPYPDGNAMTVYTLRVNRLRYAQYICSTKIPSNSWVAIPNVSKTNLTLDDFLDPDKPSLVEASIEFTTGMHEAVTPAMTAFGSSRPMGRQNIRKWVSQVELAWLVQHANVHVTAAIQFQGSESLSESHELPKTLTADPIYALSIAAGLVAECHWVGLSSMTSVRRVANSATAKFVDIASPAAVWLRAADRAYCFAMAKVAAEFGFTVRGYGYGSIVFYGPKNGINQIAELADKLGTCHPCLAALEKRMLLGQDSNAEVAL